MRVFWADFSKLRRPLTFWLTIVVMGFCVLYAANLQGSANARLDQDKSMIAEGQRMVQQAQSGGLSKSDPAYIDVGSAKSFLATSQSQYKDTQRESAYAASTQRPLGSLGIALGLVCSIVGAFALVVLASGHVAGEWTGLTIKEALIADRRRGMTILAKMASLFAFGVWLVVCSWIAVMLWGLVSKGLHPALAGIATNSASYDWAIRMTWKAPVAILFFAALAVFLSILIRNNIGTVLAGIALIVGVNILGVFVMFARYTPASWLAAWMDFRPQNLNSANHYLWMSKLSDALDAGGRAVQPHWTFNANAFALGVLIVAIIAAAVIVMRRRDAMS
jgi:ABC-type transport system involved in multi-copper enzyme maturation permease subunit